ncbi:MAG: sulfatase [Halanaerobium sp.]
MKVIMVLFDTLRKKELSPYGNDWIETPNFDRLEKQSLTFDNHYAGSLPCMPARREMHTGRYNFLHRSWGPLEPFDDSLPEILKENDIYTHLVTDHSHYLEDGGATYHNRFSTAEIFRGQEGDRWKDHLREIEIPEQLETVKSNTSFKQNWVNRLYQKKEEDYSSYKTFEAGLEFLENNKDKDDWLLQIESFDPHEPFRSPEKYQDLYPDDYSGKFFDWPSYQEVTENKEAIEHIKYRYAASISMCDNLLGKVLDMMDKNNMWEDTMLIVSTDHGFLLGEHNWWGKNIQPCYNEIANIPFFIWNPDFKEKNSHRNSLSQIIDIAPTILDYFNLETPENMEGKSLNPIIKSDEKIRDTALFGVHGGHINLTDGKYVYMRSSKSAENQPLYQYTLMPTHMRGFFRKENLEKAALTKEFSFTNNIPVLKIPTDTLIASYKFGSKLFDLDKDPAQENNLIEKSQDLELKMISKLKEAMIEAEAPAEQFERLGLDKN